MRRAIGMKTTSMTGALRKTARCLAGIVAVAAIGLSSPGLARADLFSGSLWLNTTAAANATVANAPARAADITFTTNAINFNLGGSGGGATVAQFFASNSSAVNITSGAGLTGSTFTFSNNLTSGGYILFTGSTFMNAGSTSYSVTHDDGAQLVVNGQSVFSAPGPTSAELSTGTATAGAAGNVAFSLSYGEVNGTPAVIEFNPAAPHAVPEPSTLAIAGLGALGMIGYGLRRRKVLGA